MAEAATGGDGGLTGPATQLLCAWHTVLQQAASPREAGQWLQRQAGHPANDVQSPKFIKYREILVFHW
jgi:hypothetical protein